MLNILQIVLPTFIIIFIGYLFGKIYRNSIESVVNIALYIAVPVLVFSSMLEYEIVLFDAAKIWAAASIIIFGCPTIAWLVFKVFKQKHSGLYLPIAMMNNLNIPFPIIYLVYGSEGLVAATLFLIPWNIIMNSFGIYIGAGGQWRDNIKEITKQPVFYASVLGLILNILDFQLPALIISSLDFIAPMAIPLVLIILGFNLSKVRLNSIKTTLLASFLRMGVGLGLGLVTVNIFNIEGVFRAVVILISAMPAAAMSSIFVAKYKNEAELVSSVVLLTTIASLFTIPLLLKMLG
ncbi:AEC family transporter [Chloroflexota bacterium]